jgi:hypothetical protein
MPISPNSVDIVVELSLLTPGAVGHPLPITVHSFHRAGNW